MEDLENHRPALRRYLERRLRTRQGVEDLVQEAFLRVWVARQVRALRSPVAFLFTTAKNLVLDQPAPEGCESGVGRGARGGADRL